MGVKIDKGWSSHQIILIKVIQASVGDVVELGGGYFSTPLLHWLCKEYNRKLTTYEDDEYFYEFAKRFTSPLHRIRKVTDWNTIQIDHIGVLFIDHHPCFQRAVDAIRFRDSADYVILHDTEKPAIYDYDRVFPYFKNRYDWTACRPHTTVVSNSKDLTWLN